METQPPTIPPQLATESTNPPNDSKPNLNKKTFTILGFEILLVLIVGITAYLIYSAFEKHERIQAQSLNTQKTFEAYAFHIQDIEKRLEPTAASTVSLTDVTIAGLEESAKKMEASRSQSVRKSALLKRNIENLKDPEVKDYKNSLSEYLTHSQELASYGYESTNMFNRGIVPVIIELNALNQKLQDPSLLASADPVKIVSVFQEINGDLSDLESKLNSLPNVEDEYSNEIKDEASTMIKLQIQLIDAMNSAIQRNDVEAFYVTQQEVSASQIESKKRFDAALEKGLDKREKLVTESRNYRKKVDSQYKILKNKYDF